MKELIKRFFLSILVPAAKARAAEELAKKSPGWVGRVLRAAGRDAGSPSQGTPTEKESAK